MQLDARDREEPIVQLVIGDHSKPAAGLEKSDRPTFIGKL
jgi:hypothetical protein